MVDPSAFRVGSISVTRCARKRNAAARATRTAASQEPFGCVLLPVVLAVWNQHDVRPLLEDDIPAVTQVARGHVDPDQLAELRLIAGHHAPTRIVEPIVADLVH